MWIWELMSTFDKRTTQLVDCYQDLAVALLREEPSLAAVRCDREPYTGISLLHLACATGNVTIVEVLMVEGSGRMYVDLNWRATGQYVSELMQVPESHLPLAELATPQP